MMYVSSRHENKTIIDLKLPWDSNTARGFLIALFLTFIWLLFAPYIKIEPAAPYNREIATIPLTLLNFGDGDGTGMSKGNLTPEGATHQGIKPTSDLEDAAIAAKTKQNSNVEDPENSMTFLPTKELSSNQASDKAERGSDSRNIGSPNGTSDGTGLGDKGFGKGKGSGFGDIEWGGGGNRVVLYKKIPKFPDGVNSSAQIKMKFTVQSDGTVSSVMPMQKADPRLERAAIDALRQWRFNPLKDDVEMVGIIPLTFMLR